MHNPDQFNVYEDALRAETYSALDLSGTYYLAFRDLPDLIGKHVRGTRTLDFGCGAGRSTRFFRSLGLDVLGVDISESMIARAQVIDPLGDYQHIPHADLRTLQRNSFDLIACMFTFDNIPTLREKTAILGQFTEVIRSTGSVIVVVSSPELYQHEWVSFSTKHFPENSVAGPGDIVRTIIKATQDDRPVEDVLWPDECYCELFEQCGFRIESTLRPLATGRECETWVNETNIAPWVIYLLKANEVPC